MSENKHTHEKSLARGDKLTPETWANFIERLHHDCVGEGVDDHCTADAIFIVQAKRRITGIDMDYTDQWLVYCDESEWLSPQEYWDDLDDEGREDLDAKVREDSDCSFLELDELEQWDVLGGLDDHTVTGWDDRWEYVCSHFTKDSAESFIRRKKHDYQLGLRVYVDAQSYCWEFNAIKEAILSGLLVFNESQSTASVKGGAA